MHSLAIFLFVAGLPTVWQMDQKALDEFVKAPDSHYQYRFVREEVHGFLYPVHLHTINMTSQKWLNESEVDKPVWSHELLIVLPQRKKLAKSCLLIIRPSQNDESTSSNLFNTVNVVGSAITSQSIIAVLRLMPDQPITFYNHPLGHKNITGHDIWAYSWWRYLNDATAPPHWLVEFPMVKGVMRAMDTITEYMKKKYRKDIKRFTLMGVSMAGWVTWLTAAVDRRVELIIPIAMDFLNFTESFHHQYRSYCGWSYMLRPLHEMNITQELDNPRFSLLTSHVDPLAYNERYTNITKYIIVLSGDELFQPDNSDFYFSQLEGKKYLRIIPNSDYGFQVEGMFMSQVLAIYVNMIKKKYPFPNISWEISTTNTSGSISFRTANYYRVYSYHADTIGGTRRDFRMKIAAGSSSQDNPVKWTKTSLREVERNVFKVEFPNPAEGWRGFFIQAVYPEVQVDHFIATSEMLIIPNTFPCPDCNGDECRGTLV